MNPPEDRLIVVGLLGVAVVVLVQLASVATFDVPIYIACFSLAGAIPLLTTCLLLLEAGQKAQVMVNVWYGLFCFVVGMVLTVAALACLFWRIHWSAAAVFVGLTVVGFGFVLHFDEVIKQTKQSGK
jgi:hypothetical protein